MCTCPLVYVAAYAPDEGETLSEVVKAIEAAALVGAKP